MATAAPTITYRGFASWDDLAGMAAANRAHRARIGVIESIDLTEMRHYYEHLPHTDLTRDVRIVELAGRIVGYARSAWVDRTDGMRTYESTILVEPPMWGRGIGAELLQWCEARARELHADAPPAQRRTRELAPDVGHRRRSGDRACGRGGRLPDRPPRRRDGPRHTRRSAAGRSASRRLRAAARPTGCTPFLLGAHRSRVRRHVRRAKSWRGRLRRLARRPVPGSDARRGRVARRRGRRVRAQSAGHRSRRVPARRAPRGRHGRRRTVGAASPARSSRAACTCSATGGRAAPTWASTSRTPTRPSRCTSRAASASRARRSPIAGRSTVRGRRRRAHDRDGASPRDRSSSRTRRPSPG